MPPNAPTEPQTTPPQTPPVGVVPPQQTSGQPGQAPQPSFNDKKVKKSSHKLAIIIAIVVTLMIIAALSYFFLVQKKDTPAPAPEPQPEQTQSQPADLASPEGIDETVKSIDQSLNSVNDQQDFTPNDVSDSTLGL